MANRLIPVVSTILIASAAFAQPPAQPSPTPTVQATTTVTVDATTDDETISLGALGREVDLKRAPFSLSVVSSRNLEESGARQLSDGLTGASSVNMASGYGIFDFFIIRGFDSLTNGLVMIDGVREPESTFLPAYNIERLEILKGPSGFAAGPDAASSTVNVLRKQPLGRDFAAVGGRYGTFKSYDVDADLGVSSEDASLSARLPLFARGSDGYRDRENSQWGFNPGVRLTRPNGFIAIANYERLRSEFVPDVGLPLLNGAVPNVSRENNYQAPFDFSNQDVDRARLSLEKKVGDRTRIKNLSYFTRLRWKSDGTLFVGAFNDPRAGGAITARTMTLLDDDQQLTGNRLWLETERQSGRSTHRLSVGLEAYELADEYSLDVALLPIIGINQPFETATKPLFLIPGYTVRADAKNKVLSAFAFDEATLGSKVQALAGVRVDAFDFTEKAFGIDKSWTRVSPFVGASVELTAQTRAFAAFSKGFSPASTLALGSREPEETRQIEGGLRFSSNDSRRRASVTAFELRRNDITIPDGSGQPRPTGDQRSRGFEFEASAEKSRVGISLTYTLTDGVLSRFAEIGTVGINPATFQPIQGVLDRSGNTSPLAPKHLFSARLRFDLGEGFLATAAFRCLSRQFIAEDNAFAIPSAQFVDASLSYSRGNARISLIGDNLLDEETFTRGYASYSVLPIPTRRLSVRLDLRHDRKRP
jgi:iron complex outermembrane receptor protein